MKNNKGEGRKELTGRRGRGGSNYFAPCILGGLIREGSSIEDLRYLQIYHVNYLGYRAKTDQITAKQVGDLRALLTARKSKGNVILTMTINAKSQ